MSKEHINSHLRLVQKNLGSKTIEYKKANNNLEIVYDTITLVFSKEYYLIGFKKDEEYFKVDKKLKSIKDLKKLTVNKFFGKSVGKSINNLGKPKDVVLSYFPKTRAELYLLVNKLIDVRGKEADLNDIDTSRITDMFNLFSASLFNGDISKWNVSNVIEMNGMFKLSYFNGDISNWDTSKVERMRNMFERSIFNKDISNWDTSNVIVMNSMFNNSNFNGDISNWNVSKVVDMNRMFLYSLFDGDIYNWKADSLKDVIYMFDDSPLENKEPFWYLDFLDPSWSKD